MNATIGVVCYTAVFRVVTQGSISGLIEELCMGSDVQVANCLVSHSFVKAKAFLSSVRGLEPLCQNSATSNGIFI